MGAADLVAPLLAVAVVVLAMLHAGLWVRHRACKAALSRVRAEREEARTTLWNLSRRVGQAQGNAR